MGGSFCVLRHGGFYLFVLWVIFKQENYAVHHSQLIFGTAPAGAVVLPAQNQVLI